MPLKKLMVFTDFTAAANVAAQHCYQLASTGKLDVISLHVISSDEDLEWAEQKSVELMQKIENYDSTVSFTPLASSQSLFRGLNKWLHDKGVGLAFMATHGKKDMQFVTGSNALKLIFNAEVPIVVVQQRTPLQPYRHIILPVFSHQAGKQFPIEVLQAIVRLFKSRITILIHTAENNKEKEGLTKTVDQITSALKDVATKIEVKSSDTTGKKFSQAAVSAAKEEGADLIAVLVGSKHHRREAEKIKKFYQAVITNEHGVPVLCL